MTGVYNFWLVALSYVIATLTSYCVLDMTDRVSARRGREAWPWLVGGSLAMGTGIWAMHFIGMLAFHLPIPLAYDGALTVLSWLLAVGVSGTALMVVGRATFTIGSVAAGAAIMGAGISAMHYTGMAAMRMSPPISYDPPLFAASMVIAVAASLAALWIAFRLRNRYSTAATLAKLAAALVMGVAICGMHYTGMAAAEFAPGSVCLAADSTSDQTVLAITIGFATLGMLAIALVMSAHGGGREASAGIGTGAPVTAGAVPAGRARALPSFETFLTARSAVLVVSAFAVYTVTQYLIVVRPVERDWGSTEMARVSGGAPVLVTEMVRGAETLISMSREWGNSGRLNFASEAEFMRLLAPVLRSRLAISSVALTRDDGRQLLLHQAPDATWWMRSTEVDAGGRRQTWRHYNNNHELLGEELRERDDRDLMALFRDTIRHSASGAIHWTEPYLLSATGRPGLIAAGAWRDPASGRTSVISYGFDFDDLSRMVESLKFGDSGQVTLLTGDGRLITVPRGLGIVSDEDRESKYLKQPGEAGFPQLDAAFRAWAAAGSPLGRPVDFAVEGSGWLAHFERLPIPGQEYFLVAFAPSEEFKRSGVVLILIATLLMLLVLAAMYVVARLHTRRFADSVRALVRETERIGALDLERPVEAEVFTREFAELRDSQEKMRGMLLEATRNLESKVEQRTRQLEDAARALETARQLADGANRAKSEFLANMSHEIRTPMNAILGMTHLALTAGPDPKQLRYLERIDAAAKALLRIINDILDVSKIEAGKLDLERIPFQLEDVLDRLTTLIGPRAEEKKLELLLRIDPGLPTALLGDPLRLGQVLLNLAGNAIKFTERGEIVVCVRVLERRGARATLQFEVHDSGIGIAPERQERLFQAFQQGDASTTRNYGGTGLGLAICRQLVGLMGGRIWVESEAGKGSTFSFTAQFDCQAAPARRELQVAPELAGTRVLVVDDNAIAREILQKLLESMRFRVGLAAGGAEALAEARAAVAAADPYRVVLMDFLMPGMDGVEAARALRSAVDAAHAPKIVLVTAIECREVAPDAGLDGFLTKPVTASLVFDAMMEACGHRQRAGARVERRAADNVPSLVGARVLLVEDNEVNQEVARELLERAGLSVDIADNGKLALERAASEHYDLVLMDLQMPVMDGYEATRAMRRIAALRELPIVAMTANAMAADRQRCLEAGMNAHVAKPIDVNELYATIERWLGPRRRAAPAATRPELLPAIEGVDVQAGMGRAAGDAGLYRRILAKFSESQAGAAAKLREFLASGDGNAARHVAHTLSGVAGNIGAMELHTAARAAEAAIVEGAVPAPAQIERIEALLERLRRDIGHALAAGAGAAAPAAAPDPAQLAASLAELGRLIEESDTGAAGALERLRPFAGAGRAALEELARHLERYDFDAARAAFRGLAAALNTSVEENP